MKKYTEKKSFGILLYTEAEKDQRKYLIIQNRDSEAFIYFFLSWNMERWTDSYLQKVLRGFSKDEIHRLLFYPFEILYTDLYVNHKQGTFQKQYERARANYQYFHSRKDWCCIALNTPTSEIKWGFPKGRQEANEPPLHCALRELKEEVGILHYHIKFITNHPTLHYVNEKILFKTRIDVNLFPATCNAPLEIPYKYFPNTIRCRSVSNEILHAKWVDIQEASIFLTPNLYRLLCEFHLCSS